MRKGECLSRRRKRSHALGRSPPPAAIGAGRGSLPTPPPLQPLLWPPPLKWTCSWVRAALEPSTECAVHAASSADAGRTSSSHSPSTSSSAVASDAATSPCAVSTSAASVPRPPLRRASAFGGDGAAIEARRRGRGGGEGRPLTSVSELALLGELVEAVAMLVRSLRAKAPSAMACLRCVIPAGSGGTATWGTSPATLASALRNLLWRERTAPGVAIMRSDSRTTSSSSTSPLVATAKRSARLASSPHI